MLFGISQMISMRPQMKFSCFIQKVLLAVEQLQIIGLLYSEEGQNSWAYSNNAFYVIKKIMNSTLITPYLKKLQSIFLIKLLAFSLFMMNLYFILMLFLFTKINYNQKMLFTKLCSLYLILLQTCLFQPQIYFFFQIITFNERGLLFQTINFDVIILFSIFSLMMLIFLNIFGFYFFRNRCLNSQMGMEQKYTFIGLIKIFMQIILICINFQSKSHLSNFILIITMNLYYSLIYLGSLFKNIYSPFLNKFYNLVLAISWSFLLIISINVFSEGKFIKEYDIIIYQLVLSSLTVSITNQIVKRKYLKQINQQQISIEYGETLEEYFNLKPGLFKYNKFQNQLNRFYLVVVICNHSKYCNCCNIEQLKLGKKFKKQIFVEILNCLFIAQKRLNSKFNQDLELLEIYYLEFLYKVKKQPLLAFAESQKCLTISRNQSNYFKIFLRSLQIELQQIMNNQIKNDNSTQDCKLKVKNIIQACNLENKFLPQFRQLLDLKMEIWTKQTQGFNKIFQLQNLISSYCNQLISCQNQIKKDINLDLNSSFQYFKQKNVIELKLVSIFQLIILNDIQYYLMLESKIQEIVQLEKHITIETVSHLDLLNDNFCLIQMSMVKKRGEIKNSDKTQIGNYFGYDSKEIQQLNNINQLLPQFILEQHDSILLNYLETGKSNLLKNHQVVVSKFKDDFVQANYLKLENDFTCQNDYSLIGCLSKVQEISKFLLFDGYGKIISISSDFINFIQKPAFDEIIPANIYNQSYIFIIVPEIYSILQYFINSVFKYESYILDAITTLVILKDLQKIITQINNLSLQLQKNEIQNLHLYQNERNCKAKVEEYENQELAFTQLQNYQNFIFDKLSQKQDQQCYNCTSQVRLRYYTIGSNKPFEKSFFLLEILDCKNQFYDNNYSFKNRQLSSIIYQKLEENQLGNLKKQTLVKNQTNQISNIINLTLQEKQNQKVFANPHKSFSQIKEFSNNEEQQRQEQLQRDTKRSINTIFPELQIEYEQNYEQDKDEKIKENLIAQSNGIDSNNNQLLKVFSIIKERIINQKEHQSISSNASESQSNLQYQTVRQFINSKDFLKGLKVISILSFILIILIIFSLIINIEIIKQQTKIEIENSYQFNCPLLFNRHFFQSYSLSWLLLMNSLNIVDYSEFSTNQTFSQLKNMENQIFSDLSEMYPSFIQIENSGLLPNISLKLLGFQRQTVSYTQFIDTISNFLKFFFRIKYNYEEQNLILHLDFINSVITLRYNLRYVFEMNKDLIFSLDLIGQDLIISFVNNIQVITIIEITLIFIFLFTQLWFWKQVLIYKQKILYINCRLNENDTKEMIIKHQNYKKILQHQENFKISWKKLTLNENYHPNPLNLQQNKQNTQKRQNNFGRLQTNLNKKKNDNYTLNLKVKDQSFSIGKFLIFKIISFFCFASFLLCGQIFYSIQISELIPQQQITSNFLRFSSYLDTLITGALVIKTQSFVYKDIVAQKIYSQEQMNTYRDPLKQLFHMFLDVYEVFDQNITKIYEDVESSILYSAENKDILLSLFQQDLCLILYYKIPFCQLKEIGQDQFIKTYSTYLNQDNSLDYISKGLFGIISDINKFIKSNYNYEIETIEYSTETDNSIKLLNSQEFQEMIIQHFLTVAQSTELILEIILQTNEEVMIKQNHGINLYFILVGLVLLILFIIGQFKLIHQENQIIIQLRLGLTLIPVEIITDQYTTQIIKRLI